MQLLKLISNSWGNRNSFGAMLVGHLGCLKQAATRRSFSDINLDELVTHSFPLRSKHLRNLYWRSSRLLGLLGKTLQLDIKFAFRFSSIFGTDFFQICVDQMSKTQQTSNYQILKSSYEYNPDTIQSNHRRSEHPKAKRLLTRLVCKVMLDQFSNFPLLIFTLKCI